MGCAPAVRQLKPSVQTGSPQRGLGASYFADPALERTLTVETSGCRLML
jgi:hypothetical protein